MKRLSLRAFLGTALTCLLLAVPIAAMAPWSHESPATTVTVAFLHAGEILRYEERSAVDPTSADVSSGEPHGPQSTNLTTAVEVGPVSLVADAFGISRSVVPFSEDTYNGSHWISNETCWQLAGGARSVRLDLGGGFSGSASGGVFVASQMVSGSLTHQNLTNVRQFSGAPCLGSDALAGATFHEGDVVSAQLLFPGGPPAVWSNWTSKPASATQWWGRNALQFDFVEGGTTRISVMLADGLPGISDATFVGAFGAGLDARVTLAAVTTNDSGPLIPAFTNETTPLTNPNGHFVPPAQLTFDDSIFGLRSPILHRECCRRAAAGPERGFRELPRKPPERVPAHSDVL
ncbi:MAG: hypothetical protein ACYDDF_04635 [Thermoplasmatota archaeon]